MSKVIDQHVAELRFDNQHFEKNVQTSMSTLDKLKQKLNFKGASKGLDEINASTKKIDMSGLGKSIDTVGLKFNGLYTIADQALRNITNRVMQTGENMIKALTLDPVTTGFQEYETKMNAVQVIQANTRGKNTMAEITAALDDLNTYADKTIYNFTQMTSNIGKFTAQGLEVKEAAEAVKGLANLAAASGASAEDMARATYQMSQALSGTIKLMDWNSLRNANMATVELKNTLIELARVHGVAIDDMIKDEGAFEQTLSKGWLTGDMFTEAMNIYSGVYSEAELKAKGFTDSQVANFMELAATAESAATEVKTFTQLWDVLKETAQSGWTNTWELIIGDFDTSKKMLTELQVLFSGIIDKMSDKRNAILKGALSSPFDSLIDKVKKAGFTTEQFEQTLIKVAHEAGIPIETLIKKYGSLTEVIKKGKIQADVIKTAIKRLLGIGEEAGKVTDKVTMSVEQLNEVVKKVINGDFGNGEARIKALTEAGYDYATVQNKVNELLGSSKRYTVELTESQIANADSLAKLSDAQLKEKGYTEEQIKALRELEKAADATNTSIEDLIDKPDGRWLIIDSFKNMWEALKQIFGLIGNAWKDIFGDKTIEERSNSLYSLIEKFHEFTESMTMSEKTASNFKTVMEGIFAGMKIGGSIASKSVIGGLKILNAVLNLFGTDLLGVAAKIAEYIIAFNDWIEVHTMFGFDSAYDKIAKVLKAMYEGISKCVTAFLSLDKVKGIIANFRDLINDLFGSLNGAVDFFSIDGVIDSINKFFDRIKAWIKGANDAENLGMYIIQGLIKGITSTAKQLSNISIDVAKTFVESFKSFFGIASPSKLMITLGGFIIAGLIIGLSSRNPEIGKVISGIGGIMMDGFQKMAKTCLNFLQKIDFGKIIAVGLSVGLIAAIKNLTDVLKIFSAPAEGLGKLLGGIGSAFKSFGDGMESLLKAKAFKDRGKAILNIAIAIGILVAAVALLCKLDLNVGEVLGAIGIIAALAGILVALSVACQKLNAVGEFGLKSLSIVALSASLLMIAFALKQLSTVASEDMAKGLALFGVVVVGFIAILQSVGELTKGSENLNVKGLGKVFTKLAISMLIMIGVIKLASMLKASEVAKGAVVMGLVTIFYRAVIKAMSGIDSGSGKVIKESGKLIRRISVSLLLMIGVIKLASMLSLSEVAKGSAVIAAIGVLFAGFIAMTQLLGRNADSIKSSGGMMLKMSAALLVTVIAIKMIAGMSVADITKAVAVVYAIGVLFAALTYISKFSGANAAKAGLMLIEASVALLIMSAVLIILKDLDSKGIAKALGVITAMSLIFAGLIAITYFAKNADKVKGTLITLTVAIGILAVAIIAMTFLDQKKVKTAAAALSSVIGMFALLIYATSFLKSGKKTWTRNLATIVVLTAVVGALAGIISQLANLTPENAIGAAKSLSILLLSLSSSLLIMSKAKSFSRKNMKNMLITLGILTVIAGLLGIAIKAIGNVDPRSAVGAATGIGILLLAISTSLDIVSRSKSISAAKLPAMLKTLGTLAIIAVALGAVIYALRNCNPQSSIGNAVALGILLNALALSLNVVSRSKTISKSALPGVVKTLELLAVITIPLAAVIYGLRNCDPTSSIGNAIAIGLLLNALSLALNIVSRSKSINKEDLPGILTSLGMLAAVTGALGLVIYGLRNCDPQTAIGTASALSTLLVTLSLLMIPLSLIGKESSKAIKGAIALTAMAIPLTAFAVTISKIPDISKAKDSVVLLAALMAAMTALLVPLTIIGNFAVNALLGVVALTAMVAPLAAFAFALSKIPDLSGTETTVTLLAKLMTAMTLLLVPLTLIGALAVLALGGVIALTAMVIPLATFAFALNKIPDLSDSIQSITILSSFMSLMTDLLMKVTPLAPLALVGVVAIGAMGGVITAFGVLATVVGALMSKFPALEEFLNKGLSVLAKIAEGLGTVIGKFITGFSNEVMSMLPNLGMALSGFMTNAMPFIVGIKMVDETALTGVKNMTKAILLLTAAEFVSGLAGFVGLDIADIGNKLGGFATSILPFVSTMKLIDPSAVESAKTLVKLVLALAGADFLSAVTDVAAKVFGLDEMSTFSDKLNSFAKAMADFSATLKANGADIDPEAIRKASEAGLAMVKLANAIPKTEGFLQDIVGEADLEKFGKMCKAFGKAIKAMSDSLTGEDGAILVNQEAINAAVTAGKSMSKLANAIPKSEGFLQDIVGESDLARFGSMCQAFGEAIKDMSTYLTGEDGAVLINDAAVEAAVKAGKGMSKVANSIPKKDGFLQDIVGEQDLATFGATCKAFGTAIKEMSSSLSGEDGEVLINDEAVASVQKAGLMMAAVQKAIPEDKWLDGKISIDDFGRKINSFGTSLVAYGNKVSELDPAQVAKSITQAQRLANLAKSVVELDTSGISKFNSIPQIGTSIKNYSNNVAELNPEIVSSSITSANRLRNFIASLVDLDTSGIERFKLTSIGNSMRSYINSVQGMDTGVVITSIAAANRLRSFMTSLIGLDASGVANFKPASIGMSIRQYAVAVTGIDPTGIFVSINAANQLKSFITSLAGFDGSGAESFRSAVATLGKVNATSFVESFRGCAAQLGAVGASMIDSLVNGITSRQASLSSAAHNMTNVLSKSIIGKQAAFKSAGVKIITGFAQGISSSQSKVKSAVTKPIATALTSIRGYYGSFYSAGGYLVSGFAAGITANTFMAEARAAAMASAALRAAKAVLKINSPSKVFREVGKSVPEGFAQGIGMLGNLVEGSSVGMANTALNGVQGAISKIAEFMNTDVDSQPTIRPVLDLSDVSSGASAINGMFGMTPSVGVMANVGSISSMMNGNQNRTNADVVSAINKLRSDLGNVRGDTYQVGNVTYDDGSNISDAVKTLVRAARVERRI